jgi:hypothetical protein
MIGPADLLHPSPAPHYQYRHKNEKLLTLFSESQVCLNGMTECSLDGLDIVMNCGRIDFEVE